jgi:anti-sigma B factor antagonist
MEPYFDVAVDSDASMVELRLTGELDVASAPLLERRLAEACTEPRTLVVVDLAALTYCDSSGVRALVCASRRCADDGGEFRVIGARGAVRRVFEITNTSGILNVQDENIDLT